MGTSTLITNARIFDGEETITEHGYIFLEDGLISKIGPVNASAVPSADICVNASGHTILPGLIDAHVHVHKGSVELAQALRFGVTTVLDLFNEPDHIEKLKSEAANRTDIADVKSACFAATIPGGWPRPVVLATTDDKKAAEERIAKWPELESPDQAEGFVIDMKSRGADFIKLMHESGEGLLGNPLPLPSYDLQRALIQAAHSHGLITLAHALTQEDTLAILAAGTDGLAHSFCDEAPKDELLNAYRKNNSFLIPTLVVSATLTGAETENTEQFAGHPLFSKVLNDNDKACYCGRAMMAKKSCKSDYSYQTVRMLHKGGIDIVAGTDAATGLPGTAIGLSLHQELCLYVERCGLTPLEALRSATSVTARRFGLEDRGKLTKGKRADLLMVKGNPTVDIGCTLDVKGVWRSGISTSI